MKNIHLIPTDKPSRLVIDTIENKLSIQDILHEKTINILPQHIYITSNEEIKDGDYCINLAHNIIVKPTHVVVANSNQKNLKKIILTTDQYLIGVQAIDDGFLEWYVKNPSCEEVEVKLYHGLKTSIAEISAVSGNDDYHWKGRGDFRDYKITIPKEELTYTEAAEKEERIFNSNIGKKETLEEDAERFFDKRAKEEGFENWTQIIVEQEWELIESLPIEFVKWQQERMYSNAEVIRMLNDFGNKVYGNYTRNELMCDFVEEWFEQFKKK